MLVDEPKKNVFDSLKLILVGGALATGLYFLLRKKYVAAPAPAATLPPPASPADPSESADDGGIIDVQGLGYTSTRNRIRRRRL